MVDNLLDKAADFVGDMDSDSHPFVAVDMGAGEMLQEVLVVGRSEGQKDQLEVLFEVFGDSVGQAVDSGQLGRLEELVVELAVVVVAAAMKGAVLAYNCRAPVSWVVDSGSGAHLVQL